MDDTTETTDQTDAPTDDAPGEGDLTIALTPLQAAVFIALVVAAVIWIIRRRRARS